MNLEEKLAEAESLIKHCSYETDYDVEHELGRGKFAIVKRCVHKKTGKVYAAKLVKKSRSNTHGRSGREQLLMEISVLSRSTHPKMVRLYDVFETRLEMQIILEFAEGGDLHRHCIETDVARTEKEICYLIRQILEATRYLHDEKIVHLDLKPDNILLAKKCEVFPEIRLIDFGLSRSLEGPYSQFDIVGTPEYVAPEVLAYDPIDYGSDMWSIGVVTYVLLSGISPFAGDNDMETYSYIGSVEYDFDCEEFDEISDEAISFIEKLLLRKPGDRMTAREALEHEWIKQLDGGVSAEDVMEAQQAKKEILPDDLLKSPIIDARLSDAGYVSSSEGDMSSNSVDVNESSGVEEVKVELPTNGSDKVGQDPSAGEANTCNNIPDETNGHTSLRDVSTSDKSLSSMENDVDQLIPDNGPRSVLANSSSIEDMSCESGDIKTGVNSDGGARAISMRDPNVRSEVPVLDGHLDVKKGTAAPVGARHGTLKNDFSEKMNKFSCKEEKGKSPPTSRQEGFRTVSTKPFDTRFLVENTKSENRSAAIGVQGNNFRASAVRKFANGIDGRHEKDSRTNAETESRSTGATKDRTLTTSCDTTTDESKVELAGGRSSTHSGMVLEKKVEDKAVPRKFPINMPSRKMADEICKSPPPETKPKPLAPSKIAAKDESSAGSLHLPKPRSPKSPRSVINKREKENNSNELSSNSLFKLKQSQTKDDGIRVSKLSDARETSEMKSPPPPVAAKPKSPVFGAPCPPTLQPPSANALNEVYLSCKMPTSKSDTAISLRAKADHDSTHASTPPTKRHISTASNEVAIKLGSRLGSSQISPRVSSSHSKGEAEQDNTKTELKLNLNIGGGKKKLSIGPLLSKGELEGQKVVKQVKISAVDNQNENGSTYSRQARNKSFDGVAGDEGEHMTLRQRYSVPGGGKNDQANGAVARRHSTNSSRSSGSVSSGSGKTYRRLYVTKVRNSKIYEHDFDIVATEAAKIAQRIDKDVAQADVKLKSTDLKLLP